MEDSSQPRPILNLRGNVTLGRYGKGSKSEREAVFLETEGHRYLLRRKGGPAFADAELKELVGHGIECDGFLLGTTLLADRISRLR